MLSEFYALNRIRVERNLTYEALANQIGLKPQTLYRVLNVPNPHVHDRTLFKIQRFLAQHGSIEAA